MRFLKKLLGRSEEWKKFFPEIEDVFNDEERDLDLVFFPLCSINLKEIIPERDEWIHFVDVWNNGDIEASFFHDYRTKDSICFQLEKSKYSYFGDEKAFPKYDFLRTWKDEAINEFEKNKENYLKVLESKEFENSMRKIKEDERRKTEFDYFLYVDQVMTYSINKERFKKSGKLINHKSYLKGYPIKAKKEIKQIGGSPQWLQRDQTPLDKEGKPFTFIGEIQGFDYMRNGSDGIFLFLDEKENEVIQIIQFG